jgi:preprotein translocase subunit SecD
MLRGTDLPEFGRRHPVRRADHNDSWPTRCQTVACVLVLAVAAASCGASKDAPTSPSLAPPSTPADPDSRRLAMQQRPVLEVVYHGSPAWKGTTLTCAPHDDTLMQCVAQTLDSNLIVLVGARRDKYILGPIVLDGSDVLQAVAVKQMGGFQSYWEVHFRLTGEGARGFADTTREAIGRQIAIIIDGQVVSAPIVQGPILNGQGVIAGSFDGQEAKDLAAQLNGSA